MVKGKKVAHYTFGHHCTGAPANTTLGNDCGGPANRLKTVARTQDFRQAALGEPDHLLWSEEIGNLCKCVKGKGEFVDQNAVSGLLQIVQVMTGIRIRGCWSLE